MTQLAEHPTVKKFREQRTGRTEPSEPQVLDAAWLRQGCLDAGADDVGFVERVSLDDISRQAQPNPIHPQHGAYHHG